MTERRACRRSNQPRGTQRYCAIRREDEDALTQAIVQLASQYGRYGYRRITTLLKRAGWRLKPRIDDYPNKTELMGLVVLDSGRIQHNFDHNFLQLLRTAYLFCATPVLPMLAKAGRNQSWPEFRAVYSQSQ